MKVFRRIEAAIAAANGKPILSVGKPGSNRFLFVVFDQEPDLWGISQNLIELVDTTNGASVVTGDISLQQLDRLGHANMARGNQAGAIPDTCFPPEEMGLGIPRASMMRVSDRVWRRT